MSDGSPSADVLPRALSNSGPNDAFHVTAAGVHTVSFAWSGLSRSAFPADLTTVSQSTGDVLTVHSKGRSRWITDSVSGVRVGWSFTGNDYTAWVEGTLAATVTGRATTALAQADDLLLGPEGATLLARSVAVNLPDPDLAVVRRCDLAVDSTFSAPADGRALLRGAAELSLPRHRSAVHHAVGSNAVEGVQWGTTDGIKLRLYDKGTEERPRTQDRGRIVRIERQDRPRSAQRASAKDYRAQDLSAVFARPLKAWSTERVTIASPSDAYFFVKGAIGQNVLPGGKVLTDRIGERLMGSLMRLHSEGDDGWSSQRTARARRRELRSIGIEVDGLAENVIDLGAYFRAVRLAWSSEEPRPLDRAA